MIDVKNVDISCPDEEQWRTFLLGQMPLETVESFGHHLTHCKHCERQLEKQSVKSHADPFLDLLQTATKFSDSTIERFLGEPACGQKHDWPIEFQPCKTILPILNTDAYEPATPFLPDTTRLDDGHLNTPLKQSNRQPASQIGDYRIIRRIGRGGFADVYLGKDARSNQDVAIKFPRIDRTVDHCVLEQFAAEGRALSDLDHASIVHVYEVAVDRDGAPYLVTEFVDGMTLKKFVEVSSVDFLQSTDIVRQLADGLQFAHKRFIVHRDLKPSNIMIDIDGCARITDFGLAFYDNTPIGNISSARAGTLAFMAPEQLRGENHRIDGRTDIWALGVVMYWLFTRRTPYQGTSLSDFVSEIRNRDPKPIRQLNETIPAELARVCTKCLARLRAERYQSAADVIEDIDCFLEHQLAKRPDGPESRNQIVAEQDRTNGKKSEIEWTPQSDFGVVPRGLRFYDANDSDFFLHLLPGPTDRFGIPDSLRFWLQAFGNEQFDLSVGLLFGPSGCGKSSFVRAALLPRLPESIVSVYIECSSDQTELDLVLKICRAIGADFNKKIGLVELLQGIRLGKKILPNQRVLLVLDQFEQWLHASPFRPASLLVDAIRQCDGKRLQTLILVRDDFWIPTQQFFSQLEVKIEEGTNAKCLPLFDKRHARKVLTYFGRGFNALPPDDGALSDAQREFVRSAVASLSNQEYVVCAHIALFAEMMKNREWITSELSRVEGWQGIGVSYLEDIFSNERASPSRRRQLPAIQEILRQLLPSNGDPIKGGRKTQKQLEMLCPSIGSATEFDEIIRTLDTETRLIARTVGDEDSPLAETTSSGGETKYQLAHDILVSPVLQWLNRKQKETWTGRSQIRISELATLWVTKKENRHLPNPIEYSNVMLSGLHRGSTTHRTPAEFEFLKSARSYYSIRFGLMAVATVVLAMIWNLNQRNATWQTAEKRIDSALTSRPDALPIQLEELMQDSRIVKRVLQSRSSPAGNRQKVRFSALNAHFDSTAKANDLTKVIHLVSGDESRNFIQAVKAIEIHQGHQVVVRHLNESCLASRSESRKMKLAITAMALGDLRPLRHCISDRQNPSFRSKLIHLLPSWNPGVTKVFESVSQIRESEIRIAVANVAWLLSESETTDSEQESVKNWLEQQLFDCDNAGVYFAARSAMQKWNFKIDQPILPARNGEWMHFQVDPTTTISMARIPPGVVPFGAGITKPDLKSFSQLDPVIKKPFYISTLEVGADLFFQFVDDPQTSLDIKNRFADHALRSNSGKNLPINRVSRREAAQFCNWLNTQTSRSLAYAFDGQVWQPNQDLDVFRLPKIAEWERACRADSTTAFFFGDASLTQTLLRSYGWHETSSLPDASLEVGPRGSKLPNDFGVFDMIGNASEWTHDTFPGLENHFEFLIRGGYAGDSPKRFYSGSFIPVSNRSRSARSGIRLVLQESE